MPMNQLLHKLIGIGQAADLLCHALPNNHRLHMALRDLSYQTSNALLQLSDETRKKIASN
jgi:hypothetical protein